MIRKRRLNAVGGVLTLLLFAVIFVVPFAFIALQAMMDPTQAANLAFELPRRPQVLQNLQQVFQARDYMLVIALINSAVLTVASVTLTVIFCAMAAFVMQRRPGTVSTSATMLVLAGLIIPPAVVPTIWVLQSLGLFRTLPGMIFIEVAYHMAFGIMLFRAFIATIPRELDEAAIVDGAGTFRLFFTIVLPLLRPVIITNVVVQSVAVFNDFVNPLYYLPQMPTAQLTLYNFQSQFQTQYNLLFMNILLITIPPLIVFIFFNRQMVAGMTSGAVKG